MEYRDCENDTVELALLLLEEDDLLERVLSLLEEEPAGSDDLLEQVLSLFEEEEFNQPEGCGPLVMLDGDVTPQPRNLPAGPVFKYLHPQPFRPSPSPRRPQRYRELWRLFDPHPPKRRPVYTPSNISDLFDDQRKHGTEKERGRRFVRERTIQDLHENNTAKMMAHLGKEIDTAFYLRHVFSYPLRNI